MGFTNVAAARLRVKISSPGLRYESRLPALLVTSLPLFPGFFHGDSHSGVRLPGTTAQPLELVAARDLRQCCQID